MLETKRVLVATWMILEGLQCRDFQDRLLRSSYHWHRSWIAWLVGRNSFTVGEFLIGSLQTGGMATWYIGAPGEGRGNPYGIVIATVRTFQSFTEDPTT